MKVGRLVLATTGLRVEARDGAREILGEIVGR